MAATNVLRDDQATIPAVFLPACQNIHFPIHFALFRYVQISALKTSWYLANAANTFYDVEIYDAHRMVYEMKQISESQHTLVYELEPCQTYRWSVRPTYRIGDDVRIGEWMQYASATTTEIGKGIVGRNAAAAPAYIQNFALLEFECRRK